MLWEGVDCAISREVGECGYRGMFRKVLGNLYIV